MTAIERARAELAAEPDDVSGEQARAEQVAAARRHRRRLIDFVIRLASLTIALTLWEIAAWNVDPVLFTSPSKVVVAAYHMVLSGELWTYLWPSLVVLAIGFAFAVVLGVGIGLLLARFWVLDVALTVYITFLYSIPSVALVPLIVLWAGFDTTAKVIILFLFAFFPMVINTYQGVKSVDPKLLEVGRAFRCSEGQLWGISCYGTRIDRHGARRSLHRDLGHRLPHRAHREHLPGGQDVRADRDARHFGRDAHGAAASGREICGALDRGVARGLNPRGRRGDDGKAL
jgi:hypothetical protein